MEIALIFTTIIVVMALVAVIVSIVAQVRSSKSEKEYYYVVCKSQNDKYYINHMMIDIKPVQWLFQANADYGIDDLFISYAEKTNKFIYDSYLPIINLKPEQNIHKKFNTENKNG